jgi:signal transduction histidine kinase
MLFHELRNQMVVVCGYTRLLLKNEGSLTGERSREYMEKVNRSSEHLARLAEELLRAGQLSPGALALSLTPLLPAKAIGEVTYLLEPLARQQEAVIEVAAEECVALANEQALRLILSSLLENALKYGGAGNLVQVRCALRNGRICLEVEDGGPGIDPQEEARIFEKDYRGQQHAGRTPGTGMGLYTARTLAAVMGGELQLRNPSGKGSCFILWLQAAASATALN